MSFEIDIDTYKTEEDETIELNDKKWCKFKNKILKLNKLSCFYLKNEELEKCINILNDNEKLIIDNIKKYGNNEIFSKLLTTNLNNKAIYYKHLGYFKISWKCLLKVKDLEEKLIKEEKSLNITRLNISVVYSNCFLNSKKS